MRPGALQRVGLGLGLIAVVVTIFDGDFDLRRFGLVVVVALVAGVVTGLWIRRTTTLEDRLRVAHQLNPYIAQRLLPDPDDPVVKAKSDGER